MAVLNTNTRYLHEEILGYAERLADLLPDPLGACFLVCSGSEANELALRLACTHTGSLRADRGGRGLPREHAATDRRERIQARRRRWRGRPARRARRSPARHLPRTLPCRSGGRRAAVRGDRPCGGAAPDGLRSAAGGFIAESLPGCGGQIVPPRGWLGGAYEAVRGAGGVCIADEVQTWASGAYRHPPLGLRDCTAWCRDIVTLGKPIGNGHPLAAVVTTPEIARLLRERDGVLQHLRWQSRVVRRGECGPGRESRTRGCRRTRAPWGTYLLERLQPLLQRHALIGDVRGAGLFVGIELVRDRETLEPAGPEASAVVERLRERGVLMSTDGPLHNVLKIKPPIVWTRAEADRVVDELDAVLAETAFSARGDAESGRVLQQRRAS